MIVVRNVPLENPALDPERNPDRLVFDAWGSGGDYRTPPEPCVVCGAERNACTDADHQALKEGIEAMRTVRVQGTDTSLNDDPASNLYVVPDDVVEEYVPPGGARRPSRRLVYRKGEVITRTRAYELGLIEDVPAPTSGFPLAPPATIVEGEAFTPVQD